MRLVIACVLLQMASPTTASCFIYILIPSPIYYFTLWWKIKELFNLLQHEPVLDIQLDVWTFLEASPIFILSSYIMSSGMENIQIIIPVDNSVRNLHLLIGRVFFLIAYFLLMNFWFCYYFFIFEWSWMVLCTIFFFTNPPALCTLFSISLKVNLSFSVYCVFFLNMYPLFLNIITISFLVQIKPYFALRLPLRARELNISNK